MSIDFTDLNKYCPEDDFPLLRIDKVIDVTTGSEMLSLLDCFSGYHQIWVKKVDEEKTSFITPFGMYCFIRMTEGLKNAGPTFCKMSRKVFKSQIGRNVHAYVDDVIVKSRKKEDHRNDLAQTFANLRAAKLKINRRNASSLKRWEKYSNVW